MDSERYDIGHIGDAHNLLEYKQTIARWKELYPLEKTLYER